MITTTEEDKEATGEQGKNAEWKVVMIWNWVKLKKIQINWFN
jgi:hypothetical protein